MGRWGVGGPRSSSGSLAHLLTGAASEYTAVAY